MIEQPVRYGVISAGRMAGVTMSSIMRDHPAARPVSFYEIAPARPDTAERIAELRALGIDQCDSLAQLLERDDVDVILNTTPHFAHAETTIEALQAGRTVVCEKPPACSLDECAAMIDADRQAGGGRLMIHFQHLLRPSARWLNQAICRGELGRIRRVTCLTLWWRNVEYFRRVDWAGKRYWGGRPTFDGSMANQTIHYLNQMLAFGQRSGESHVAPARSLRAAVYRFHPADALEMEDTAVISGVLENDDAAEFLYAGTTCAADAAGANRLSEYFGQAESHTISIEGDRGSAHWDGGASITIDGQTRTFDEPDGPWPFYYHVRNVLAGRETPITPVDQASNTMRVILGAYDAVGGDVADRDWNLHEEVSPVLRRCARQFRLPAELDEPPVWA